MTSNNEEKSSPSNVVELPEDIKPEDFPELLEQTLVLLTMETLLKELLSE